MRGRMMRALAAALALFALCVLANLAAFTIDTPRMRANAAQGVAMLGGEMAQPTIVGGFKSSQYDNFTAILKVKTAAYVGAGTLAEKAFGGMRVDLPAGEGGDEWGAYAAYSEDETRTGLNYGRYWHGYTLPLRLMLCFFNLANIEMLLFFAQLLLFALVLLELQRRGLSGMMPAFVLSWFVMMPAVMGVCIQYAPCSLLALGGSFVLLRLRKPIEHAVGLGGAFLLLGMLTSYLDLLTFPLVTLGFPLVLLAADSLKNDPDADAASLIRMMFFCCLGWGVGFAGMWAAKWLLTALVFGGYVLAVVMDQAALRVSSQAAESSSRLGTLKMNLDIILAKPAYLALMLTGAAYACLAPAAKAMKQRKALRLNRRAAVLLLPALLAPVMGLAMGNHWANHAYFTYRNLAVTVLSLYGFLGMSMEGSKEESRKPS